MSLKQRMRGVGIVGCETNLKEKYIVFIEKNRQYAYIIKCCKL